MASHLDVAGLSAGPGEKKTGYLSETYKATSIDIPVTVVNGAQGGPVLCITAGIHGCEYPGIEAATRLFREQDPKSLKGALLVIPLVNVPAFELPTAYLNPLDEVNLNRIFPGNPRGTISHRMVHAVMQVIAKANYHIDLHGGDLPEQLEPFAIFRRTGSKKVDELSEQMARHYGVPYLWLNQPGIERAPSGSGGGGYVPPSGGTSNDEVSKLGIPSIVAEAGYLGTCNESEVMTHLNGVRNIMRYLGLLDGKPFPPPAQRIFEKGSAMAVAKAGGVFNPIAKPRDEVKAGDLLGKITNIFGEVLDEVRAPSDGVVRILLPNRAVDLGDVLYRLWIT